MVVGVEREREREEGQGGGNGGGVIISFGIFHAAGEWLEGR